MKSGTFTYSRVSSMFLVPVGTIDSDIMLHISDAVSEQFTCPVVPSESLPVPREAFDRTRRQYHSTRILNRLFENRPEECSHLLAVIDEDIFIPELNFVFGVADMIGDTAIISLSRLRQEFYGLPPDRDLLKARAAKEAIHETGHTCGLPHCDEPSCVMFFSSSLLDTDRKGPGFCEQCRSHLSPVFR